MKDKRLQDIFDVTGSFQRAIDIIDSGSRLDLPLLLEAYVDTKKRLTDQLAQMAASSFPNAMRELDRDVGVVQSALEARLRKNGWKADIPRVRRYGRTHALLLAYLRHRSGGFSSTSELRVLVGDQVHTERRLRELRDLGFHIDAVRKSGQDGYVLENASLDIAVALQRHLELLRLEPEAVDSND